MLKLAALTVIHLQENIAALVVLLNPLNSGSKHVYDSETL
jgi:hypothetical protein